MSKYVLQIVAYSPKIYSGLDRMFVLMAKELRELGYIPVFLYGETMDDMPQIKSDLTGEGAIVLNMPEKGLWRQYRYLRNIYGQYKPEVVDCHFVNYLRVLSAMMSHNRHIRHFTHLHSLLAEISPSEYKKAKGRIKRFLLGVFYHLLSRWSTKVLCVSKAIERQFYQWAYGSNDNVMTLYLGTQIRPSAMTKRQAREKLGLPQDETIFVNVSAKEKLKGIDVIINELQGGAVRPYRRFEK